MTNQSTMGRACRERHTDLASAQLVVRGMKKANLFTWGQGETELERFVATADASLAEGIEEGTFFDWFFACDNFEATIAGLLEAEDVHAVMVSWVDHLTQDIEQGDWHLGLIVINENGEYDTDESYWLDLDASERLACVAWIFSYALRGYLEWCFDDIDEVDGDVWEAFPNRVREHFQTLD